MKSSKRIYAKETSRYKLLKILKDIKENKKSFKIKITKK
jgi:hypothetical protein